MAMRAAAGALGVRRAASSVAATGCRRCLSSFPSEDDKKEEEMENRVRAKMDLQFDRRVRQIVREEEAGELIKTEISKMNKERGVSLEMKNAKIKLDLDFRPKVAEHKLYLTKLINDADTRMTRSSWDTSAAVKLFSSECERKDNSAILKGKLLDGKNKIFKDNLQARQVQARIGLLKAIGYIISVPSAIYSAVTKFSGKGFGK